MNSLSDSTANSSTRSSLGSFRNGRHRKKIAIGIYPLEKIKMPIRYMAKKPEEIRFHPLEGKKEMTARQILEQHPTGKEYGYLLEGKKLFPIFVDANNQVLSMPPIINSHNVGKISEDTKDVFIECSGFDFSILKKCLNMIVTALYEMGGKIYSMELHYGGRKHTTPDLAPEEIKLDIPYINRLLGLNLNEAGAKKCLERMGHGCKSGKVLVPAYRTDILHQADFAEDIAIAFGYENFEHIIPNVATIGQEDRFEDFKNKIAGLLTGLGFIEASTYSLSNEQLQSSRMNLKIDAIRLSNSISQEYDILRAWMVPSIIEIFSKNKHHEYPQNIFAIGRVFSKDIREEAGIREADRIAVGICHEKSDYTGIRQVLDYLFSSLGMKYDVKEILHDSFIEGRVGRASVHGKEVAYIGEISPAVLENWQLTMPVAVFELNLTGLFEAMEKK